MKKLVDKSGFGVWFGLSANVLIIGIAASFAAIPSGTYMHAGAADFSLLIYSVVAGLIVIATCIWDLLRFKWFAILGFVLAVTPFFLGDVLLGYIFALRHFHEIP